MPEKWRQFLSHEGFKRYFVNTGWMFVGQIFSLATSFFIGAWIARYLGPENYGILNYALAFAGLFGFIATLGVDSILNRELVKFPERRDELLGTAFRLKLIGGLIAFCLAVIGAIILFDNYLLRLLIILFAVSYILQSLNVISSYFQAEVKARKNVQALVLATLVSSALKVVVILLNYGVIWIMVIYMLDFLWQGLGFIRAYGSSGLKIKSWQFNKNLARKILHDSWLLMLASAAGALYLKIDQVMIGVMLGNREVGLYAVAVKLVEVWYFIPGIICASLFPAIINARKNGLEIYRARLNNLYILLLIIATAIAVVMTFLARPITLFLFGDSYLAAISVLRIYVWSNLGLFLGTAVYQYLIAEDRIKLIFIITGVAMLTNIALNWVLIPKLGLVGAAWATLISYAVVPLGGFYMKKSNHLNVD